MKVLYKRSNKTIGKYRCVALAKDHIEGPLDYMIVGRKGWIFIANKAGDRLGVVRVDVHGCEKLIYCDFKELDRYVRLIECFKNDREALKYANNPNLRHPPVQKERPQLGVA